MEETIRLKIIRSFQEFTVGWSALIATIGIILIIVGNDHKEEQLIYSSLISIGSSLISVGVVAIIFRSASSYLAQKVVMEKVIEETHKKILFTHIPKLRFTKFICKVQIKKDIEKEGDIPKLIIKERKEFINLQNRSLSKKEEEVCGIPENQEFIFKKIIITREDEKPIEISEKDIEIIESMRIYENKEDAEKCEVYQEGKKSKSYKFNVPFGGALKKDGKIKLENNFELSPCNATPTNERYEEYAISLIFPTEIFIIEMEGYDDFYFRCIKSGAYDEITKEEFKTASAPELKTSKGVITKIKWELEKEDLTHMNCYSIRFKLGKRPNATT